MKVKFALTHTLLASVFVAVSSAASHAQASPGSVVDQVALDRANSLLKQMTLDEKLQMLISKYPFVADPAGGAGTVAGIPRLNIPDIVISDSATGSASTKVPSTAFPATLAIAASWDRQLSFDFAVQIARQLRAQGFGMGLGGGTNLTRDPRGGRGFEYLGEDPELSGEMIAQRTLGTQSQHLLASIKHFDGNEQETNRMGGNTTVDERTFRELYLLPFEIAVEQGHPGSVMCSYNRLNGEYACENNYLLNQVLKGDWNFQGMVQSDWGATHSTAKAINAGLDEEEGSEPGPTWFNRTDILNALATHDVSSERLDEMVRRKLYAMITSGLMEDAPKTGGTIDYAAATAFAQHAEEQSIVLLKNDGGQLPLAAAKSKSIAVIGAHADVAVATGGGSGDVEKPVNGGFKGCGGLAFALYAGCEWWRSPWIKLDTPILKAKASRRSFLSLIQR